MGRETVTNWQVTEFVPDKKMTFQIVSGPMPFMGSFLLDSNGEGTSLTYHVQAPTAGLVRLFDLLVSWYVRQQGDKQMDALKKALDRSITLEVS